MDGADDLMHKQDQRSLMPTFVERITRFADLKRMEAEWDEIDRTSHPRTPFSTPLWNLLWWQHFRENHPWIRDEMLVLAVREAGGRLIALAPLMRTVRPAWGPLRIREIQLFGADPNVTELRGISCRPECRAEALRAIHAHLMDSATEWDSLHWCESPAEQTFGHAAGVGSGREVKDFYLPLPASWADLSAGFSRNMKEALRKCYNSLKRSGHDFTLRVVQAPADIGAALDRFFELHRARSELTGTVVHNDSFSTSRSRAFLRDYAQQMAGRGTLRIFQLVIGGEVVATRIAFVLDRQLYLYYSGYSPEWRRYSVMTTLTAEAIKWAIEREFSVVNLSTGSDYAKLRWRPEEVTWVEQVVASPMVQNRLVYNRILKLLRHTPARLVLRRVMGIARRNR